MEIEALTREAVINVEGEYTEPTYRVDFWEHLTPPPGIAADRMGYRQHSYRLSDLLDVEEALEWAATNAQGRAYVVYAELLWPGSHRIIRVAGRDPTNNEQWPKQGRRGLSS